MEFLSALFFYIVFSLFGIIGLPITIRLLPHRFLALSAAKLAGLVLFGYIIWLGSSLGIFDYQNYFLIRGLFFAFLASTAYLLWKYPTLAFQSLVLTPSKHQKRQKQSKISHPWLRDFLWIEGISLILYLLYLWLRSFNPGANGTEHFMDMAMLSAAGKTHFFPFIDPWYASKTVNYYYYGSYMMSLIANISGTSYGLTYNFALGLLFCQSMITSGAITFALTGLKKIAALAAFLVTSAGTLFYAACTIGGVFSNPAKTCSYASSTRLYTPSYIINEIPSYSFTVGNLHAHVLALPFFLLGLIMLYAIARRDTPNIYDFLFLSLSLAVSGMINAWDLVTLSALVCILVLIKIFWRTSAGRWAAYGLASIAGALVLMLPSLLHFKSPVLGIGFIPSYVARYALHNVQYPTPILALMGMWGIFIAGIIVVIFAARKMLSNGIFVATLATVSVGIIIGVELFFIKDIYSITNPPFFRANTTFKFGYHAWVMLSIAFAGSMAALMQKSGTVRAGAIALSIFALAADAVYPFEAIRQYYLISPVPSELDSTAWMRTSSPGDADTVAYINKNIRERRVIAEAVGDSYTTFARIATFTGMITPMGWQTHEWTWRFQGKAAERAPIGQTVETGWGQVSIIGQNIAQLYITADPADAKRIIDRYDIKYIYVGDLERSTYIGLDESKFYQLAIVVFESHGSKLFAVR